MDLPEHPSDQEPSSTRINKAEHRPTLYAGLKLGAVGIVFIGIDSLMPQNEAAQVLSVTAMATIAVGATLMMKYVVDTTDPSDYEDDDYGY